MEKKKPKWNENSAIRSALRRMFSRSPLVREVLQERRRTVPRFKKDGTRHKVDTVQHLCNLCNQWVGASVVEVDHIQPVIDVIQGFKDWNTYVARLFCPKTNLQIICDPCHDAKTHKERMERQELVDARDLRELTTQSGVLRSIHEAKDLKKRVTKYIKKTKAQTTQNTAKALRDKLIEFIERKD